MNIWMTGSSSGIGAKLLQGLVTSGHRVTAPTRQQIDLNNTIKVDLGCYDVVILCAGVDLGGQQSFCEQESQDWHTTLQVNLITSMDIVQQYYRQRGSQWSKIIIFGSTVTDHFWPGKLVYTVSKLALEGFCRGLRQELPPTMGITVIRPGLTRTGFHRRRHHGRISEQQEREWYDSMPCLEPQVFLQPVLDVINDTKHHIRELRIEP